MANLKDRLKRLQSASGTDGRGIGGAAAAEKNLHTASPTPEGRQHCRPNHELAAAGFSERAPQVLRRVITVPFDAAFPVDAASPALSPCLPILVPDLRLARQPVSPEQLIFFDLETTGLSGGAGTVAFLAAFGRFARQSNGRFSLVIEQFLLLDYPAEYDFLGEILRFFPQPEEQGDARQPNDAPGIIVSFNGKSFDSQILKTRCLLNGMRPPEYMHLDLLHSARCLWKKTLPSCSQASIESYVLHIDRGDDIPGALAPDIWFSFLKSGDARALVKICDHNTRDISGLARILLTLNTIAERPLDAPEKFGTDIEALGIRFYHQTRLNPEDAPRATALALLEKAAETRGNFRALFTLAKANMRRKKFDNAARLFTAISAQNDAPLYLVLLSLRALAIHAERRQKDFARALLYTDTALALLETGERFAALKADFASRRARIILSEKSANETSRPALNLSTEK